MRKHILISIFIIFSKSVCLAQSSTDYSDAEQRLPGFTITKSVEEVENAKIYISNQLNFSAIEHTPLWDEYIKCWMNLYLRGEKDLNNFVNSFIPAVKKVMDRFNKTNPETVNHLSSKLISLLDGYNLGNAAASIAAYAEYGIDVPADSYNEVAFRILTSSHLKTGATPPPIKGLADNKLSDALLVFYETECGNCIWQMMQLKLEHAQIKEKGIRIISISANTDKDSFIEESKDFPWADKLCDFEGMDGENFKNYGIISTPTIYLIDKDGKIVNKYDRLDKTGLLN